MAIKDRLKTGLSEARKAVKEEASDLKENLQRDAEAARRKRRVRATRKKIRKSTASSSKRERLKEKARRILQESDNAAARKRAKAILANADPGTGAGVGHHSPMDVPGGPFEFADPWGLTGGSSDQWP